MPDRVPTEPVTLRLHPDGHWMPNTPGRWLWRSRPTGVGIPCDIAEDKGGLLVVWFDGGKESVRESEPGLWEWVPPEGPTEITP